MRNARTTKNKTAAVRRMIVTWSIYKRWANHVETRLRRFFSADRNTRDRPSKRTGRLLYAQETSVAELAFPNPSDRFLSALGTRKLGLRFATDCGSASLLLQLARLAKLNREDKDRWGLGNEGLPITRLQSSSSSCPRRDPEAIGVPSNADFCTAG